MFNFMKKGVAVASSSISGSGSDREKAEREEKEKRKREKKQRKNDTKHSTSLSGTMSTEELLRLDEVRRSLKIRGRRKEKEKLPSGITADYSAEFFAALNADNNGAGSGSGNGSGGGLELDRGNEEIVASVNTTIETCYNGSTIHSISEALSSYNNANNEKDRLTTAQPPKPPKRGILKGSRSSASNIHEEIIVTSPEAQMLIMRNTMQNELMFGNGGGVGRRNGHQNHMIGGSGNGGRGSLGSASSQGHGTSFTSIESLRSDDGVMQRAMTLPTSARYTTHVMSHCNTNNNNHNNSNSHKNTNNIINNNHNHYSSNHNNDLRIMTSPSPSADSLTDTTNSSFATPPFSLSPIGECQGIECWSHVQTFEDIILPLPPIRLVKLPPPRQLTIQRQKSPRQDFGFSLRKAICIDRSTEMVLTPVLKPVILAEPGTGSGGNSNIGNTTGLLPGDRLLKVNGTPVGDLSREIIIDMIRNSDDAVTVEVQPVSELVELSRRCMAMQINNDDSDRMHTQIANNCCNTLKRSAANKRLKVRNNTHDLLLQRKVVNPLEKNLNGVDVNIDHRNVKDDNDDVDGDDQHQYNDYVWLIHRGGFCGALRLPQTKTHTTLENHKVAIKLLHNDEEMIVDEDDIEKMNSPSLDLIEDICELKHLNEASVLHCLRQRYANNLIHTKAGPILLVVNPMAPLCLYSEKVVSMFRGCKTEDMPPHIYSLAQTAYRAMLETRHDQSLIFMGRSGSGKTTSFKHALNYLSLAAGSYHNFLNCDKLNSVNLILEAFGNTRTCLNTNATRFTQLLSLDFDQTGQIASASIQILLPEKQRAGRRLPNEYSFHIMARLLAGACGSLQKELHLDNISYDDNHPFVLLPQKLEDVQRAATEFIRTVNAFELLNIDTKAVHGIWSILASIYHLGLAGVTIVGSGCTARTQFANPSSARKAASLLGVSLEDLSGAAFSVNTSGSTSPSKACNDNVEMAWECLEALVIGLYSEALAAVVALINKVICTSLHTIASILLIDTPGFQNPASCSGSQVGATLSDLKHNYLQERLQLLFHHNTLVSPRDRYAQELVEIDMTEGMPDSNPGPLVSLIDKAPQNHVVRSSQKDLREQDRRGLLWLLDEESIYPNANDDTFLERLFSHYGDRQHQTLLRKCSGTRQFVLQHLQGTNPVLYTVNGWVRNSREHPAIRNASSLLQDSSRDEINRLYIASLTRSTASMVFCGSLAGLEGTQSLRRLSSVRRSFTSVGVKRNSIMLQVKFTVDGIIDTLRRTGTHFVHCYLLQHNAGQKSTLSVNSSPNSMATQNNNEELVNIPLLRSQLRGSQILEATRLHRFGFPESVPLTEFVRRFGLLASESSKDITIEQILSANELDPATYRIGPSQILFRSGVLSELEAKRDELLSGRIIQLQAYCRGYLARKAMAQRRIQELAVRCIQRNVKAFLAVRDWPWWRLLVRITPLLNVHRTEEQLKIANEELTFLRNKLDKIENDRNELKTDNQKLESKNVKRSNEKEKAKAKLEESKDKEFLERVLLAMNGNRNSLTTNKIENKIVRKLSESTVEKSSAETARPNGNTQTHKNKLVPSKHINEASKTDHALSNDPLLAVSNKTQPKTILCPRPPIPPQAQNRVRKQVKVLPNSRQYALSPTTCTPTPPLTPTTPLTPQTRPTSISPSPSNGEKCIAASNLESIRYVTCPSKQDSNKTGNANVINCTLNTAVPIEVKPIEAKLKLKLQFSPLLSDATTIATKTLLDKKNWASRSYDHLIKKSDNINRSLSPALSTQSNCSSTISSMVTNSVTSRSSYSRLQTPPPRRIFPQTYSTLHRDGINAYDLRHLEQSPVIFDGSMSFVLGSEKQSVHQSLRSSPSYQHARTSSAYLSEKIQNFLKRTDHVQEEWSALGLYCNHRYHRSASASNIARTLTPTSSRATPSPSPSTSNNKIYDDTINLIERQRDRNRIERHYYNNNFSIGRSRSTQNILTKAFQLVKTLPRTLTSRSNSLARDLSDTDAADHTKQDLDNDSDLDELSELTVDLAEERSTANMATERLEAETGERLRLEKELSEQQSKMRNLQETTEKLEMELICAKSDLNGISEDEDADNEESSNVYKLKYERAARELEFTKRRLQTQHEHDLEQLIGLKKQLEKKLSDAYEEVEEQRQIVGQWKRKTQKMTNEMNDLRMLLEEQNSRNNLLEKKQRKFDAECQVLQDAARQERQAKERLSREKDVLIAEKFTLEQSLVDTRLELEIKEEKLASLQRELEEMTFGGSTEEEIAQLRRCKNELDRKVKEQEEELDEMAGQVQLLEQAKLRLEMTLETMRKEARREAQQRDEELEEARGSAYKKIKALECQLENEHEERTLLLREKHELERRLSSMQDQDRTDRQAEEAINQKLRRDLRKYKALLKDAHAQLERMKAETPGKTLIRQLRNQLEDAESARMIAMKARQTAEAELNELQLTLEETNRARCEMEDKVNTAQRDRAELQSQIDENEEELSELMKKYSATVKQLNAEQIAISEYEFRLSEMEAERNNLKEQVNELQHRLDNIENMADPSVAMMSKRLELRTKELESRLELELATRSRLEVQVARHKESIDRLQTEIAQSKAREMQGQDALKKAQKNLRELREEFHVVSSREQESVTRRKDLEKKLEQIESESAALRNDLRLALQRIADLQQAMEEGDDDDDLTESEDSHSTEGALSDLEERLRPLHLRRSSNSNTNSNSNSNSNFNFNLNQKQNGTTSSSNCSSITTTRTTTPTRDKIERSPRCMVVNSINANNQIYQNDPLKRTRNEENRK